MSYYLNLSVLSNNLKKLQNRTERQKLLSAEARRILSLCEGRPITEADIAREETGRPFFANRELRGSDTDFSISHSEALTAVSLVRGKNLRTGCDVEFVRPRAGAKKIAEELFTASEKDYIESGGSLDLTRFYQIWTLKECFLKLNGLSVFDMRGAPSFISREGSLLNTCFGQISFNLYELTGAADERYIATTAIEGKEPEQPEIRWFSEDFLAICKIT